MPDVQSARCLGGVALPSTPRTTAATVAEAPCAFCAVCGELATVGIARCLRGCILGVYTLLRVVFWIPRIRSHPSEGRTAIIALAASISIGALLGLLYGSTKYLW